MDEPQESTDLSELLCFDLYAASRAVTSLYRPILAELGLTYPQYLVLIVLWQRGTCTVGELSDALRLEYGTMTPLLRRLEARGLVTRARRPDDERAVVVALTASGIALQPRARHIPETIRSALGLRHAQAAALQTTLRMLTAAATAYTADE